MKKILFLVVLCVSVTGFVMAGDGGLVMQLGVGYHSSYEASRAEVPSTDLTAYPFGFGGHFGLGYGFGEDKMLSLGAEISPSCVFVWGESLDLGNLAYQARLFLKFKPDDILSVVAFGGMSGITTFKDFDIANINPVLGARLGVLFLYAEYSIVFVEGFDDGEIARNEISLGYSILK